MYLLIALFFIRFRKKTRDALFAYFAIAFCILGLQVLSLSAVGEKFQHRTWFYVARLVAFLLILVGIWNKNRQQKRS
jgi:peptidoglycan/LPS O-acetylase OafA/YrhL